MCYEIRIFIRKQNCTRAIASRCDDGTAIKWNCQHMTHAQLMKNKHISKLLQFVVSFSRAKLFENSCNTNCGFDLGVVLCSFLCIYQLTGDFYKFIY